MIRDRDGIYGDIFRGRVKAMGIKEVLIAPRSRSTPSSRRRAEPPTPRAALADDELEVAVLIDSTSELTMTLFMTHGRSLWQGQEAG